ncbi:MAG: hypothetical protein AAGH41_05680 [Pseudomonadota bacterium]
METLTVALCWAEFFGPLFPLLNCVILVLGVWLTVRQIALVNRRSNDQALEQLIAKLDTVREDEAIMRAFWRSFGTSRNNFSAQEINESAQRISLVYVRVCFAASKSYLSKDDLLDLHGGAILETWLMIRGFVFELRRVNGELAESQSRSDKKSRVFSRRHHEEYAIIADRYIRRKYPILHESIMKKPWALPVADRWPFSITS